MAKSKFTRAGTEQENKAAFERAFPGVTCFRITYRRTMQVFLHATGKALIEYKIVQWNQIGRVPEYGSHRPRGENDGTLYGGHICNIRHMKNGQYSVSVVWLQDEADKVAKHLGLVREEPPRAEGVDSPGESRFRCVGRRQIPIQYQVRGQLIVPNWAEHIANTAIMSLKR